MSWWLAAPRLLEDGTHMKAKQPPAEFSNQDTHDILKIAMAMARAGNQRNLEYTIALIQSIIVDGLVGLPPAERRAKINLLLIATTPTGRAVQ
jgi:hypothetical protein